MLSEQCNLRSVLLYEALGLRHVGSTCQKFWAVRFQSRTQAGKKSQEMQHTEWRNARASPDIALQPRAQPSGLRKRVSHTHAPVKELAREPRYDPPLKTAPSQPDGPRGGALGAVRAVLGTNCGTQAQRSSA